MPQPPAQKKKRVEEIDKKHEELSKKKVDLNNDNDPVMQEITDLFGEKQELTQPELDFGDSDSAAPAKKKPPAKKKKPQKKKKKNTFYF